MKFYDVMYPDHEQRGRVFHDDLWHVRAMQLWNDWNTQVYEWATNRRRRQQQRSGDSDVEYLWMRSEDLLPGSPRRLECLQALAAFVGSTLTPEQICCLSRQGPRDYGKSIVHDPRLDNDLFHDHAGGTGRTIKDQWKRQERDREKAKAGGGTAVQPPGEELEAIKASLRQKEESLRSWQAALEEREASLEKMSKKGPDAVTYTKMGHAPTLPLRRRLVAVQGGAKVVPSSFLRDFQTWEGLSDTTLDSDLGEVKTFLLDGLITHGQDLLVQWDLNHLDDQSQALEGLASKARMTDLIQKLRVKLQEVRLYDHRMKQVERPGDPDVQKRYGKWQNVLSNNTELADYFYREGKKGLELFGYHPYRDIEYISKNGTASAIASYLNTSAYDGISCDESVACAPSSQG